MRNFLNVQPNRFTLQQLFSSHRKGFIRSSQPKNLNTHKKYRTNQNTLHLNSDIKPIWQKKQRYTTNNISQRLCKMPTDLPKLVNQNRKNYLHKNKKIYDQQYKKQFSQYKIKSYQIRNNEFRKVNKQSMANHPYLKRSVCKPTCSLFRIKCENCRKSLNCFNKQFESYLKQRKLWGKDFLYRKKRGQINHEQKLQYYASISDQMKRKILDEIQSGFQRTLEQFQQSLGQNSQNCYHYWRSSLINKKTQLNQTLSKRIRDKDLIQNLNLTQNQYNKNFKNDLIDFNTNLLKMFEKQSLKKVKNDIKNHKNQNKANNLLNQSYLAIKKQIKQDQFKKISKQTSQQQQITPENCQNQHWKYKKLKQKKLSTIRKYHTPKIKQVSIDHDVSNQSQVLVEQKNTIKFNQQNFNRENIKTQVLIPTFRKKINKGKFMHDLSFQQIFRFLTDRQIKIQDQPVRNRSQASSQKLNISGFLSDSQTSIIADIHSTSQKGINTKRKKQNNLHKGAQLSDDNNDENTESYKNKQNISQTLNKIDSSNKEQCLLQNDVDREQVPLKFYKQKNKKYRRRYGFIQKKEQSQNQKQWKNLRAFIRKNQQLIQQVNLKLLKKNINLPIQVQDSQLTKNRKIKYIQKQSFLHDPQQYTQYTKFFKKGLKFLRKDQPDNQDCMLSEEFEYCKSIKDINSIQNKLKMDNLCKKQYQTDMKSFISFNIMPTLQKTPLMFYDLKKTKRNPNQLEEVEHNYYLAEYQRKKHQYQQTLQHKLRDSHKINQQLQQQFSQQNAINQTFYDGALIQINI